MKFSFRFGAAALAGLLACSPGHSGTLYKTFPDKVNPEQGYLFYSHGFIVEGENETPVHPRWGTYDFPGIKQTLAPLEQNVIAFHRPAGTDPHKYSKQLAAQVSSLLDKGVAPENITLAGFSRGGALSILASHHLKNDRINVVILAGCAGLIKKHPEIKLYGRILSIYETSDQVGSCQFLLDRREVSLNVREIAISTGKEHGAFYRPVKPWVEPLADWLKEGHANSGR